MKHQAEPNHAVFFNWLFDLFGFCNCWWTSEYSGQHIQGLLAILSFPTLKRLFCDSLANHSPGSSSNANLIFIFVLKNLECVPREFKYSTVVVCWLLLYFFLFYTSE